MKFTHLKYIIVLPFFCFAVIPFAIAQKNKADSLLSLLKKDKADTFKINHLNLLGWELMYNNPDTSIILSNEAITLCEQLSSIKKIRSRVLNLKSTSLGHLGAYNYLKANYPKALNCYLQALKIDEEQSNKHGVSVDLGNIGLVYWSQGDYPKALDYYFKALKMAEERGDKSGIASDLANIGSVYSDQADYSKALNYYSKALKIDKEIGKKKGIVADLGLIANAYADQGDVLKADPAKRDKSFEQALEYYSQALKIAEEIGDKNEIAIQLGNMGIVYKEQGDYHEADPIEQRKFFEKALEYYLKTLKIREKLGAKKLIVSTLGNIGSLCTSTKKYNDAFDFTYHALALSDSLGAKNSAKELCYMLSELYEKSNIPLRDTIGGKILTMEQMRLRALHYFKSYLTLRDTLFGQENKKQLIQKELNYQFEKKEAATKAEADKQSAVAASESKKQSFILILVSFFLILVLIFAALILRALRITKKQKQMIETQQELMEEKQKEILDSIHYAKRIQTSLLPTAKYIDKTLKRLMKKN